jgi:hypothetical protein
MNLSAIRTKCCCLIILFLSIIYIGLPLQSTAATPSTFTKLEVLDAKVDLLQKINERLLNTVYWTLATLAVIFVGLISVNLYFNISANKRELAKNKEDIENLARSLIKTAEQEIGEKSNEVTKKEIERIKEDIANITTSAIKTSEANLIEKINVVTQQEINKASINIFNAAKNEILTSKAEITKQYEESEKKGAELVSAIKQIEEGLSIIDIRLKELEAYKFSQEGKMGAIYRQIDLLEYDLTNRPVNLKYRLPYILEEVKTTNLDAKKAERLKKLLGTIEDKKHERIVKEILYSITVNEPKES